MWMKLGILLQHVGLLKLILNYFAQVRLKGENSTDVIFMKYITCQDICEQICFKLGMMLNIAKLCSVNLV